MSSSNFTRWSGLAAFVGGVLFAVLSVVEALLFGNQAQAEAAATTGWVVVQDSYLVAVVLITLGVVGLYLVQKEKAGTLGGVAFVVAFCGSILAAGAVWSEAFFGAWLAEAAPELLDAEPSAVLLAGVSLSYVLFTLGWFLFGLASQRAGVLPGSASVLLMLGALLFLMLIMLEIPFAGLLFGVAIAWIGYALWSRAAAEPEFIAKAAT